MKKTMIVSIMAMAVAVMCVSCAKEEISSVGQKQVFTASSFDAKTTLSGTSVLWINGDVINVYNGTNGAGAEFTTTLSSPAAKADFTGTGATKIGDYYYAFYPAAAFPANPSRGFSNKYVYFTIPQEQTAVMGQLPASTNVMVARSGDEKNFTFNHCAAFIKFTVGGTSPAVKSVSMVADGCKISGTFRVTFESMAIGTYNLDGAVNYDNVVLKNGDEGALEAGTYYMAVRATEYKKGVTFVFQRTDGKVAVKTLAGSRSLVEGDLMDLGTISLNDTDFIDPLSKVGTTYSKGNDKGVIFWVNPANPMEGKAVSAWASNDKVPFVSDGSITKFDPAPSCKNEDGAVNVSILKETNEYKNAAAGTVWAFDECEKEDNGFQDGGWYLPSTTELKLLFGAVHGLSAEASAALKNKDVVPHNTEAYTKFNAALVAAGGSDGWFDVQKYLWSSEVVNNGDKIMYQTFNAPDAELKVKFNGGNNEFNKTCHVRCVKKVTISY